jgi:hypothetical protein
MSRDIPPGALDWDGGRAFVNEDAWGTGMPSVGGEWEARAQPRPLHPDPVRITGSSRLGAIDRAIERSRSMLELQPDWDGEGSPGYAPATWERMAKFLRREATLSWNDRGHAMPVPRISPGPDGSIDVHWVGEGYRLLLNIPAQPEAAVFHHSTESGLSIRGEIDTERHSVWQWLKA